MENFIQKKKFLKILLLNILGVILYAIGINCFAAPHNIAPGGASGIAILLNYLFNFPIGFFSFIFNIPLLIIIGIKKYFPKDFILKTLISTFLLSFVTDYIVVYIPSYKGDALLASMFAGVLMGIGLALVHLGESNTGGISLLGVIVKQISPKFKVGVLISFLNILVVFISAFIYKNVESLLYAIVVVYISGIFMDRILEIASAKNLMLIMCETTDIVREALVNSKHSITILKGEGGYSSQMQRVILCAASKSECDLIEKEVKYSDKGALIIRLNASKIEGKGFTHIV